MTLTKPKLSILVPTYNRVELVGDAIDSVLAQEFQDFEVICSDNGSTDGTFELLTAYSKKDDRIKVYRSSVNLGPIPNWGICLKHAEGEFIHWLWSDDWIEPNFYIDAFALMDKDNTRVVSTWNYRCDDSINKSEKYLSWQCSLPIIPGPEASKKILLSTGELPVSPAAYIISRDLVDKSFYNDIPALGELNPIVFGVGVDSLMVAGACLRSRQVSVLQKPSVVFRKHENISVTLGRDGTLGKLYLVSHVWFLEQANIRLNLYELVRLLALIIYRFNRDLIYKPALSKSLISGWLRIQWAKPFFVIRARFKANKVKFKS
jgi:glycosyltransferase involved in cell wall biosynthesis